MHVSGLGEKIYPDVVFLSRYGLAVFLTTSRIIGLLLLFVDYNVQVLNQINSYQ